MDHGVATPPEDKHDIQSHSNHTFRCKKVKHAFHTVAANVLVMVATSSVLHVSSNGLSALESFLHYTLNQHSYHNHT